MNSPSPGAASTSRAVVPPKGRCINPSHRQPCFVCKLPSSRERDSICYLISEASGPEGIEKLKDHVQQSPEWNSVELRNQLQAKYLEFDHEDKRNLCDSLSRKDISTLTKSDLLQLCRDWEFRSDIWNYIQKATPRERLNRKLSLKIDWSEERPLPSTSSPRCIDPSHTQPCVVCFPAPAEHEEYRYQLVGDPGRKNGEKKLRKFIQMTQEWNSSEMRKRVANAFKNRPDLGTFGKVIQNKEAANLRKPHLIRLCREWNFKSNIWQVKKVSKHGKKPTATSQQGGVQASPSSSPIRIKTNPQNVTGVTVAEEARGLHDTNIKQQQQHQNFALPLTATASLMDPGPSSTSSSQDPKAKLIGLISKMNEAFADSGKKLQQLGSHFWTQDKVAQLFPKKAGTYLSTEEIASIFRASHVLLQSSREMFQHFAASTESHTRNFGVDEINVIALISGTQLMTLSQLKLEATKAELLRMRSQMTLAQSSGLAWFEISDLTVESIFTESEKTLTQAIASLPPVFPNHLEKWISSILMTGLNLFTSCRCLMSILRFCGYGVYLDSLIHTITIFSEYFSEILKTLNHLVAVILKQMISASSDSDMSPLLQSNIQALLQAGSTLGGPAESEEKRSQSQSQSQEGKKD